MQLKVKSIFEGPSPYAVAPVVVIDVQGMVDEWMVMATGLGRMGQLLPYPTSARVADPSVEATAAQGMIVWAKGALNAVRGFVMDAGVTPLGPGVVRVWLGYHVPRLTVQAISLAVETALAWGAGALDEERQQRAAQALKALHRQTRSHHPDYQIRHVMQAARELHVPVLPVVREARVWQVGWGARQRVFFESATHADSFIGAQLARNKVWAKQLLSALGAPVAPHVMVSSKEGLRDAAQLVGWPCVVKPVALGGGKGVTADLRSEEAMSAAFDYARQFATGPVMVERHIEGADHRLLVIGGRLVSAVRRAPSFVVGDGQRTLRQLIDDLNASRRQEQGDNQHRIPVVEDDVFHRHLADQGFALPSMPALGLHVTVRSISNIAMGGYLEYVSDKVHPTVRAMAESIAAASGLNTIGLDYITTNIGADWHDTPGAFVEINATPGLDGLESHPGRTAGWAKPCLAMAWGVFQHGVW